MNTIIEPENIPLLVSGRITSKSVLTGPAPRSMDASSRLSSSFSIAVYNGSIMKGIRQYTIPSTVLPVLYRKPTGSLTSPIFIRNEFNAPLLPRKLLQPYIRISELVQNGIITSIYSRLFILFLHLAIR